MTKEEIIKTVARASGAYTPHQIFRDWIECLALSVANASAPFHDEVWKRHEEIFESITKKYDSKMLETFAEMTGGLIDLYESGFDDFLGDIYMKAGCGSGVLGQFFTPYHLSRLMAEMAISDTKYTESEPYTLNEPSCGGGASIIAAAEVLQKRGINYQKCMKVVAQDLDWMGVYMTYIACSFYGIDAIVVQGDTLIEPYVKGYPEERVLRTPRNRGCLI